MRKATSVSRGWPPAGRSDVIVIRDLAAGHRLCVRRCVASTAGDETRRCRLPWTRSQTSSLRNAQQTTMGALFARLRGGGGGSREEEHRPSRVTDQDRAVLVSSEGRWTSIVGESLCKLLTV